MDIVRADDEGEPNRGWTRLHLAAMKGQVETCEHLLADDVFFAEFAVNTAVLTFPSGDVYTGATPLHLAAFGGHADVTTALLQSERFNPFVNLFLEGEDGEQLSALHVAANAKLGGHTRVVECLLLSEHFSDESVNAVTRLGCSALHLAASTVTDNVELVSLLLEEPRFTAVNTRTYRNELRGIPGIGRHTALTIALCCCNRSVADLLCQHPRCEEVEEATKKLCRHDLLEVTPELSEGWSLFHLACERDLKPVVQLMLALPGCRPAVNARERKYHDATALHVAVWWRQEEIALILLQSRSFEAVNAVDPRFGRTALHMACELGLDAVAVEIIRHPLFAKQHKDLADQSGKTARLLAQERGLRVVAEALDELDA